MISRNQTHVTAALGALLLTLPVLSGCASSSVLDLFVERHDAVRWMHAPKSQLVLRWTLFPVPLIMPHGTHLTGARLCKDGTVAIEERAEDPLTMIIGVKSWTVVLDARTGGRRPVKRALETSPVLRHRWTSNHLFPLRVQEQMELSCKSERKGTSIEFTNVYLRQDASDANPVVLLRMRDLFDCDEVAYYPIEKILLLLNRSYLVCVDLSRIERFAEWAAPTP